MQSELAFFTTQDIVNELMRRKTFLGVVIHAADECRGTWTGEKTFKVHVNGNLSTEQAGRLLDTIADHIEQNADE